jgi:HlyD family secretion protein
MAIIVLVLAAAAALWLRPWETARAGAADGTLQLYGNVEIRDAALAFNGSEHVAEVLVEEGDPVKAGQVLARLQTDRLEAERDALDARLAAQQAVVDRLLAGTRPQQIAQAEAELAAAQARVDNAQRVVERLAETAASGASSAQGLDDARATLQVEQATVQVRSEALGLAREGPRQEDIDEAKATLAALTADRALLQRRLDDSTLTAPAAGYVQSRLLEPGEFATPERPVLTLALRDPKWVRCYLPEPDLGKVRNGAAARVTGDAFPGRAYDGQVGFISPVAEFTPKSVETSELRTRLVYELRVYVQDPHDELRLGMPVTVTLGTGGGTDGR